MIRFPRVSGLEIIRNVAVVTLLLAACPPTLGDVLGASRNDVAVKVAELPERYRDWIVRGVDFSADGTHLAVESDGEKVNIWDWRTGHIDSVAKKPHGGNGGNIANPIRYSADGRFLAACESSGEGDVVVRIWNTTNWLIAKDLTAGPSPKGAGTCTDMGFTADGKLFIRTADNGGQPGDTVLIYSTATWEPLWGLSLEDVSPVSMAISPDERHAAIAGSTPVFPEGVKDPIQRIQHVRYELHIYIVDLQQRKLVKRIEAGVLGPLAWSPDGQRIAIAGGGVGVEILDSQSGKVLLHDKPVNAGRMNVRFAPDGRYLVDSDLNGMGKGLGVKIWDGGRQKLLQHIPGDIGGLAVSRDGKYLAVGTTGHTTIWQFK